MYEKVLILEKAVEIFAAKGFYLTTLEEIAARTNLKKAAVSRYFKNKEELFIELLLTAASARQKEVFETIGLTDDFKEKLTRFTISFIRFAKNQRNYYKLLTMEVIAENREFTERVRQIQDEYQHFVYQILQDGIRQGRFQMNNPLLTATFLGKLIEGAHEIAIAEPNYSPDQIVLSMLDLVWNGLLKK